jgi:hypothetical protein
VDKLRVYFAGFSAAVPSWCFGMYLQMLQRSGSKIRELTSFVECSREHIWRHLMEVNSLRCEFFLDSGAFSAWSKGTSIDLEEYAQFILDRPDTFNVIANLDVIPGAWGEVPTQRDIDRSAEQGWENFYALEKLLKPIGKRPINIYHQGEDKKWLKKLMDEQDYFGVSPGNDRTTRQKIEWLDAIMPTLTDDKGWPIRKFHGFGVTSLEVLLRYPWYSVDSTSWVLTGRFGAIHVPLQVDDGVSVPDALYYWTSKGEKYQIHKVIFSSKAPKLKEYGQHFKSYSKVEQEKIMAYVHSLPLDPASDGEGRPYESMEEQLAQDYVTRDQVNILFFLKLEKDWLPKPFKRQAVEAQDSMSAVLGQLGR